MLVSKSLKQRPYKVSAELLQLQLLFKEVKGKENSQL